MSGRVRADETVRVKGSNPSWLDRDREKRDGRAAEVATKVSRHRAGVLPGWAAAAEADEDVRDDDDEDDEEDGDWRLGLSAGPIIGVGGDLPSCEPKP